MSAGSHSHHSSSGAASQSGQQFLHRHSGTSLGGQNNWSGSHHLNTASAASFHHGSGTGSQGFAHRHYGNNYSGNYGNSNNNHHYNNYGGSYRYGGSGYRYGGYGYGLGGFGYGFGYPYYRPFYGYGYRPYYGFGFGNFGYGGFYGLLGLGGYGYGGFGYGGYGYGFPYYRYNSVCSYGGMYSPYGYGYGGYGYGGYGSNLYATNAYASIAPVVTTPVVTTPTTPAISAPIASIDPNLQLAQADPASPGQFADRGESSFKTRDFKNATYYWRHAVVDDPKNGVLVMMLGQSLFATGQFEEAAGATQAGIQMLPKDQWGVVAGNYKELYTNIQDYTDQLRALEKAVKDKPDDPATRFLVGYHYGYLGYPKEAIKELDKTLELAPKDEVAKKLRDAFAEKLPKTQQVAVPPTPGT